MLYMYQRVDGNRIQLVVEHDDKRRFPQGTVAGECYDLDALDRLICSLAVNLGNLSVSSCQHEAHDLHKDVNDPNYGRYE